MADEMRERDCHCTVIAPGMVDTPFFDGSKPDKLQAEVVAQAVIFAGQQGVTGGMSRYGLLPRSV
jgi:hypothetical protein